MDRFQAITVLLVLAAFFTYVNERFLRLPMAIGVMLVAFVASLALAIASALGMELGHAQLVAFLTDVDFSKLLMRGMLCFLLFAGALHVPVRTLEKEKWLVLALAVLATTLATFLTGTLAWLALRATGFDIDYVYALMFGAIVSPTDPIAAVAILTKIGLPKRLETLINGESLFNDGVGVVLFTVLSSFAFGAGEYAEASPLVLFTREVLGGAALGALVGALVCWMLRGLSEHGSRALLTLAAVAGGYATGRVLGVSGPIATVVAGIAVGNFGLHTSVDATGRRYLVTFWRLIDDVLNGILFALIGLEVLLIPAGPHIFWGIPLCVGIVLASRAASVAVPMSLLGVHQRFGAPIVGLTKLLTWAGMRGGLAVALALSLPAGPERDMLTTMTYGVVVFSVIVQGLTIKRLFPRDELEGMMRIR